MLNKKGLFRGGLYLVNTAVVAISTSSVVVAESIEDAKFKVATGQIKDAPWFIDGKYDESIKQVIGKALTDCVTNRHEFKDKEAKDLITFKGSIIKT